MSSSNFYDIPAIFNIDISSKLGKDHIIMIDDIVRMVLIQMTIQLMFYLSVPNRGFITEEFVLLLLYIILGICLYWLVFKHLIKFI